MAAFLGYAYTYFFFRLIINALFEVSSKDNSFDRILLNDFFQFDLNDLPQYNIFYLFDLLLIDGLMFNYFECLINSINPQEI